MQVCRNAQRCRVSALYHQWTGGHGYHERSVCTSQTKRDCSCSEDSNVYNCADEKYICKPAALSHHHKSTTNLGRGGGGSLLGSGLALTEAVLEATVDRLEVGGTASAGGLSALGLEAPVERTELGSRVTALSTGWGLVEYQGRATRTERKLGTHDWRHNGGWLIGRISAASARVQKRTRKRERAQSASGLVLQENVDRTERKRERVPEKNLQSDPQRSTSNLFIPSSWHIRRASLATPLPFPSFPSLCVPRPYPEIASLTLGPRLR